MKLSNKLCMSLNRSFSSVKYGISFFCWSWSFAGKFWLPFRETPCICHVQHKCKSQNDSVWCTPNLTLKMATLYNGGQRKKWNLIPVRNGELTTTLLFEQLCLIHYRIQHFCFFLYFFFHVAHCCTKCPKNAMLSEQKCAAGFMFAAISKKQNI